MGDFAIGWFYEAGNDIKEPVCIVVSVSAKVASPTDSYGTGRLHSSHSVDDDH